MSRWMHQRQSARRSLPSRGAWIEIERGHHLHRRHESLPSRGAWIEIQQRPADAGLRLSLPSRGAWIEIWRSALSRTSPPVAPLAGSVDRNLFAPGLTALGLTSLPSRGAWIEIGCRPRSPGAGCVAPLAGSVDRNSSWMMACSRSDVAPLAGSVDRNFATDEYAEIPIGRSPRGERG